jgi:hypothetical protein
MDEEFDRAPRYQEESYTITDETRRVSYATDTPHRGMPDRTLDDVVGCSFRIKPDRRAGNTGIYLGFERRGRLNSSEPHAMAAVGAVEQRPISDHSSKSGQPDGQRWQGP